MNIDVRVLGEPELEFGNGATGENPKAVLPNSGPFLPSPDGSTKRISLGLVAPASEVPEILAWFERMETLIVSDETNAQRYPAFPGVERVLRCHFAIEERCIVRLSEPALRLALARSGNEQFQALLDLYQEAIASLFIDSGPDCILVQFSEEIAALRITNPALSYKERRVLERLREEEQSEQMSLFEPSPEEMKVAEELAPQSEELLLRNFHRALKARCMMLHNAVPIQIIRRQTYVAAEAKQSDATRAWNLTTGLHYKAGNIPWRPFDLPAGVCFAGVSFHHLKARGGNLVYCSIAHAFSNDLEPFVLKGAAIPHKQTRYKQPYLTEAQSAQIVEKIVRGYELRAGTPPTRVVIHKTSTYQPEEEEGFRDAALEKVADVDLVSIRPTGFRLLRRGMQEPLRSTLCRVGENRNFLFTTGYVPWWEEYPGPHIPAPVEIGAGDVEQRSWEILSLTKLNWNSADGIGRLPITLSFARRVGMVMTELGEEAEPNPSYRFYM